MGEAAAMSDDGPIPKSPRERRASRRNTIHVRVHLSDTQGSFCGRSVDVSRAEKTFGFRAQVGFDEGLRRTIEWYRKHRR